MPWKRSEVRRLASVTSPWRSTSDSRSPSPSSSRDWARCSDAWRSISPADVPSGSSTRWDARTRRSQTQRATQSTSAISPGTPAATATRR